MVSVNQLYLFILLLCIYKYIIYIYLQNYQDPLEAVLGKPLMTNTLIFISIIDVVLNKKIFFCY